MMVLLVGLAVLVGSGVYALMRSSGGQDGQPQSVVARQSPKPPSTITFTPASVETLPPVATNTPAPLPAGDAGEEQTPQAQGIMAPYDPSWTPAPLPDNLEMRGNCLVLKSAVEVFPEDAVAAGGRVFDIPYPPGGRAYSLPDGRCITFLGDSSPPDWLPPDFLTPEPGYDKRGNCVVPEGAVEVFTDEATAAGGRVFEYGFTRYFSLPDGRCIPVTAGRPLPDWVPPDRLTPAPQPEATPTGEARGPVVPAAPGCPECRVKASDQLPVEAKDIQLGADGKYFIPDRGDGCRYEETGRGPGISGFDEVFLWAPHCEGGWTFVPSTGQLRRTIG